MCPNVVHSFALKAALEGEHKVISLVQGTEGHGNALVLELAKSDVEVGFNFICCVLQNFFCIIIKVAIGVFAIYSILVVKFAIMMVC